MFHVKQSRYKVSIDTTKLYIIIQYKHSKTIFRNIYRKRGEYGKDNSYC